MIGNRRQADLRAVGQGAGARALQPEIAKDLYRGFDQPRSRLGAASDVSVRLPVSGG